MLDNDTPFALAVVGAAGSGKSTIALQIAERSGAMYLDKDALAGPLVNALLTAQGESAEERESNTFYRDHVMPAEYAAIFAVASDNLRLGHSVVIDAPFAAYLDQPEFFSNAAQAAHWPRARRSVLHVYASEAQTQRRLRDRGLPRDQAKLRDWNAFWPTWGDLTVRWTGVRVIKVDNDSTADIDSVLAQLIT